MSTQYIAPEYRLDGTQYTFFLDGEPLFVTDEVALLISRRTGGLIKHGPPNGVTALHAESRKAYLAKGMQPEANDLICFIGKFPVEDLNKMVSISDYAGRFFQKLLATVRQDLPETAEDLAVFRASRSASPAGDAMRAHLGMTEGAR